MASERPQPYPHRGGAPQVLLEDLTLWIDVALIVAFGTSVHLLRQRMISAATLAHLLSVPFLVLVVGHYIERHMIGQEEVESLVRRRGPGHGGGGGGGGRWWLVGWWGAGLLSTGAISLLGTSGHPAQITKCWGATQS